MSSEEQEADSLTESQADAQSVDDSSNPRARIILPQITSHVRNCHLTSCETCRKLRRISKNIETKPLSGANSLNSDERVHPMFSGGANSVSSERVHPAFCGDTNSLRSYRIKKSRRRSTNLTSATVSKVNSEFNKNYRKPLGVLILCDI